MIQLGIPKNQAKDLIVPKIKSHVSQHLRLFVVRCLLWPNSSWAQGISLETHQLRHPYQQGKPKRRPHHERQHALHWRLWKFIQHSVDFTSNDIALHIKLYIYGSWFVISTNNGISLLDVCFECIFCWSIVDGTKLQRLGATGPWNSRRSREATATWMKSYTANERDMYINHVGWHKIKYRYDMTII